MTVVWSRTVKSLRTALIQLWKNEGNGGSRWYQVDLILASCHWIKEKVVFLEVTL